MPNYKQDNDYKPDPKCPKCGNGYKDCTCSKK